jgi:hypothetical protein
MDEPDLVERSGARPPGVVERHRRRRRHATFMLGGGVVGVVAGVLVVTLGGWWHAGAAAVIGIPGLLGAAAVVVAGLLSFTPEVEDADSSVRDRAVLAGETSIPPGSAATSRDGQLSDSPVQPAHAPPDQRNP